MNVLFTTGSAEEQNLTFYRDDGTVSFDTDPNHPCYLWKWDAEYDSVICTPIHGSSIDRVFWLNVDEATEAYVLYLARETVA